MQKLINVIILLFVFVITANSQSVDENIYFPEEYFISENAVVSDTIIFMKDDSLYLYNDYDLKTLSSIESVLKGTKYQIGKTINKINYGKCIVIKDTIIDCTKINRESYLDIELNEDWEKIKLVIGDNINYYSYMGEGYYLLGIEQCEFWGIVERYEDRFFKIIVRSEIIGTSKYIDSLKGWIEIKDYHVEIKRIWAKYY